jgi:hypothetical protein
MCRWNESPAWLVLLILLSSPAAPAADFLRGDANDDGRVSISDSHFIFSFLFRAGNRFECRKAADVDDSGVIDITDAVLILNHIFLGGSAPAAPFPSAGADATADELSCESYGNGQPLEDPDAEITVLDATAAGGHDSRATLVIAISSSRPLGGYSARIRAADGALDGSIVHSRDLTGTKATGFESAKVSGGVLTVGFLVAMVEPASIAPGTRAGALEVRTCVRDGLPAGEYALAIEDAELIDAETGRAIRPRLASGKLTVESDVAPGIGCTADEPPPPPVGGPGGVDVNLSLRADPAGAGRFVAGLMIESNARVEGFSFSLDFDEDFLRLVEVEKVFRGGDWESFALTTDNSDVQPGGVGTDEGYLAGEAVLSADPSGFLPAGKATEVLRFLFELIATPEGCIGARFADGGVLTENGPRRPIANAVRALGATILPEDARSFTTRGVTLVAGEAGGVERPEDLEAEFRLASADARPGLPVAIPFSIDANAPVQGFSFSVDFDEEVLEGTRVEQRYFTPDGTWDFWKYQINNSNATPGNAGIDEGYVVGGAVFDFTSHQCGVMRPGSASEVLRLHFEVLPETSATATELVFLEGGRVGEGLPGVENVVTAFGAGIGPDVASSFVFLNGRINIAPDIAVFIRGDSDGNGAVELTDAQQTLGYLFLGDAPPACEDAADADDSGKLAISDPVLTLNRLFRGGPDLPAPYPLEGNDSTDDGLGCRGP